MMTTETTNPAPVKLMIEAIIGGKYSHARLATTTREAQRPD